MQRDGADGLVGPVKGNQCAQVTVGQHVAIHHNKGVGNPRLHGGEANSTGGVEWGWFNHVGDLDAIDVTVRVRLDESIRKVPQAQYHFVNTVARQVGKDLLQHGRPEHREQLLRRIVRQRAKARSFATDEDDRLHELLLDGSCRRVREGRGRCGNQRRCGGRVRVLGVRHHHLVHTSRRRTRRRGTLRNKRNGQFHLVRELDAGGVRRYGRRLLTEGTPVGVLDLASLLGVLGRSGAQFTVVVRGGGRRERALNWNREFRGAGNEAGVLVSELRHRCVVTLSLIHI